jgi:hypothetical protein
MLNEHPEEFVDSAVSCVEACLSARGRSARPQVEALRFHAGHGLMKRSRSKRPSDTLLVYQGTLIPYVKGISGKLWCIGNRFNDMTIFKTRHTLRGTSMKSGPVRGAQQTKQCVCTQYPMWLWRCYIGETSKPLQVRSRNITRDKVCLKNKS